MINAVHDQGEPDSSWSVANWLDYLLSIHPKNIEMGLDRVQQVFDRLDLDLSTSTIITVAGTNGKGTTCAFIEQAAMKAGKSVAVYSSPHLNDYRERVRINNALVSGKEHCEAFLKIEQARGDILLTFFEFATLAALTLIEKHNCDIVLLEVGLGGRLDAVNIVEPNMAVITSIDLDHQEWLGNTRESVATEKAGIFRQSIPAVIGEDDPPSTLVELARLTQVDTYWQQRDFRYNHGNQDWSWKSKTQTLTCLPIPSIPIQNVSTGLQVIELLNFKLSEEQVKKVIATASLPGRLQQISEDPPVILDVAHNPHATRNLRSYLQQFNFSQLHLVVAMLADKDIQATLEPFTSLGAKWYVASLDNPRGAESKLLKSVLDETEIVLEFDEVSQAYSRAVKTAKTNDLIVVFGSFFTIATILENRH